MTEESKLIRAVSRWDLVALAINGVIGTAIFGLPAGVAALTGPWSPLACLLCAGIVLLIVLCFSEVSSLFLGTGGPYLYAREAFGDAPGLAAGWMIWLARVTAFAANSNLMVSFLGYFFPTVREGLGRAFVLVVLVIVLIAVNIRGVRQGAIIGDILAVVKLIPLFAFVVLGLFAVRRDLVLTGFRPSYSGFGEAVLLYVFAFTGFEYPAIPAGEALSPKKHLPMAMLTALFVAAVLYTGIQFVCVGTLPDLPYSQTAMADASARFLGPLGGRLIALTALASILGNISGMALVSPRLTFAMAENGFLPAALSAVHAKFRTPYISILLYGGLTLVLALSGTFVGMVRISVVARILPYALTCLAVPALRRKYPSEPDRFRLKGGLAIPLLAVGFCLWLLSQSPYADLLAAAAALAVGFVLWGGNAFLRRLARPWA